MAVGGEVGGIRRSDGRMSWTGTLLTPFGAPGTAVEVTHPGRIPASLHTLEPHSPNRIGPGAAVL